MSASTLRLFGDGGDTPQASSIIPDLETTGTDIVNDRIVEMAATHVHGDVRMKVRMAAIHVPPQYMEMAAIQGDSFPTAVRADANILRDLGKTLLRCKV